MACPFSWLVKAKNQHKIFEEHLLLDFYMLKFFVIFEKRKKCSKDGMQYSQENQSLSFIYNFFLQFLPKTLKKINKFGTLKPLMAHLKKNIFGLY